MGEFERLLGLASEGWLPDLLARKTVSLWRQRDFGSWLEGDAGAPNSDGLALMRQLWDEAFRSIVDALWPGVEIPSS